MEKTAVTKNRIISELSKSPHGNLQEYVPIGKLAAETEPDFFAHLIAWDRTHGQIRDAKAALPVISLSTGKYPANLVENSLAALTLLNPREFLKAYRFAREVKTPGCGRELKRLASAYLKDKEGKGWERVAIQHRHVLKELYAFTHTKPVQFADSILFKGSRPPNSLFAVVAGLKDMSAREAAGTILERKIPPLIALGALGAKAKDPDLVLALLQGMSPAEVVTNTKMLERLGIKEVPALRAAYEEALGRVADSKKGTLKITRAAEAISDEGLKTKLAAVQEKQLSKMKGVEGNWLVLGDKSGSMSEAIEVARQVAAVLAKLVKGKVTLCFFDSLPVTIPVTGLTYEQIKAATSNISAQGATSIGCGLAAAINRRDEIDGIAIISDAQENTVPFFFKEYEKYCKIADKEVPVYLYRCGYGLSGLSDVDLALSMKTAGHVLNEFDLTKGTVDYYSVTALVETMRTNQYSLVEEIMDTPLLTLKEAFLNCSQDTI